MDLVTNSPQLHIVNNRSSTYTPFCLISDGPAYDVNDGYLCLDFHTILSIYILCLPFLRDFVLPSILRTQAIGWLVDAFKSERERRFIVLREQACQAASYPF